MHRQDDSKREGRRDFLRKMAVAGGSAAVVAASGKAVAGSVDEAAAQSSDRPASGYRETEHVRAYYRTARS